MIILQILSIIFIIGLWIKPKYFFRIGYIMLLGLPIGSTNTLMDCIDVIRIGSVSLNIIHVIVMSMFINALSILINKRDNFIIKSKDMIKEPWGVLVLIALCTILLGIVIGLFNGYNFISDSQKYVMFFMWIATMYIAIKYQKYTYFIQDTCLALSINFLVIIIMNLFFSQFSFLLIDNIKQLSQESGFVSYASNISLIPIILCAYLIFNNSRRNQQWWYVTICAIISIICNIVFASNRTFILILGVSLVIIIWSSVFFKKLSIKKRIFIVIGFVSIGVMTIVILYFAGNSLAIRLLSTNIFDLDQNIVTRINTISYYMPMILTAPVGYGFGRTLPLINQFGRFHGKSNFTDNTIINIGMKTGLVGAMIFIVVIWKTILHLIHKYKKTKNNYWIAILVCFISFLVGCGIMTGQIMNNYPVTFFFGTFLVAIFCSEESKICILEVKK